MTEGSNDWGDLADSFLKACARHKILVATAESCTGGMIMSLLTDIPGSSSMVDRGFVTYSNEAKIDLVDVSCATLQAHGAVSEETAGEMAQGALKNSRAGIALAVTGIAGPDGGSAEKPVGLVWFGMALKGKPVGTEKVIFENRGRDFIRRETVKHALRMGLKALG
ncbi:MAG: CinA family protein [Mesorhizobium sp.]|nr:CinA family protein [Mesorhizobium sp.]MBL8577126.1 CinA family protein [Mesorhizobium sp.]